MNRLLLFAVLAINMSISVFGLDAEVAALKSAVTTNDVNKINQSLIQLNMAIQRHEAVDQSPWNNPSPARIQRRQEIQNALEPVKSDLIGLINGENKTVSRNANVIIGFTSGGNDVYSALKTKLEKSASAPVTTSSLYSLYQLGAADASVREIAVERIRAYDDRSRSDVAFGLLNLSAVWPLPEALPVCIELLKSDTPLSNKVIAANAIMKLGPAGAEALPDLEKLLQELEQQGGDFRDVYTIKRAIMLVCGRSDTPQAVTPPAEMAQTTPIPSRATPNHLPKSGTSPLPVVQAEPSKSSPWPWIIGAILVLAIAGGILLKLRRK
jgi:hypothetical protein